MSKFSIRPYTEIDQNRILAIFQLNTPEFFSQEEESDLIQYLKSETEEYFVIEDEGQVIGCGGINYENDFTMGIISWDIIHPEYQGKGVGGQLLKHRLDLLKSNTSIQKIIVRTSQIVFRFYEKAGFELKEVKTDYWAKGFDLYHMEIQL